MIRRYRNAEIDREKYRQIIHGSFQKNWFALPENLDFLSPEWELLILGDYAAVMPVPIVKKFGFRFVLAPLQLQQLGIFSKIDLVDVNQKFYDYLLQKYCVVYYPFNYQNQFHTKISSRINNYLEKNNYDILLQNFSKRRRESLKKKHGFIFERADLNTDLKDFFAANIKGINPKQLLQIFKFYFFLKNKNAAGSYILRNNDHILSAAVMYETENDIKLGVLATSEAGFKLNAPAILINELIKLNSPQRSFDFMGSNIENIQEFNRRFGASRMQYAVIQSSVPEALKIYLKNILK